MDTPHSLLLKLGLNQKEAQVFLSLLKLGLASVSSVARDTKITRTHIYDIVESLSSKGLLTETEIRGIKHYKALDHAGLVAHITRKQNDLVLLGKEFQEAVSIFHTLEAGNIQATAVRFYEGLEGIQSLYEEVRVDLKRAQSPELITYWPVEKLEKAYPDFYEKEIYFNTPGLTKRDIMTDSPETQQYIRRYANGPAVHSYKIWPKEKGEFPTDSMCWLDKVAFTDVSEHPSGIIIHNKAVATMYRMLFEQIWNNLE